LHQSIAVSSDLRQTSAIARTLRQIIDEGRRAGLQYDVGVAQKHYDRNNADRHVIRDPGDCDPKCRLERACKNAEACEIIMTIRLGFSGAAKLVAPRSLRYLGDPPGVVLRGSAANFFARLFITPDILRKPRSAI
jgi:hypothetical protein